MNWNYLDTLYGPANKIIMVFFIFFLVLINFASQIGNSRINIWGHVGGLIVGFFAIFILLKPVQENDGVFCPYKYWFITSGVVLAGFIITGFLLFYLLSDFN
jgi:hypothetical protein